MYVGCKAEHVQLILVDTPADVPTTLMQLMYSALHRHETVWSQMCALQRLLCSKAVWVHAHQSFRTAERGFRCFRSSAASGHHGVTQTLSLFLYGRSTPMYPQSVISCHMSCHGKVLCFTHITAADGAVEVSGDFQSRHRASSPLYFHFYLHIEATMPTWQAFTRDTLSLSAVHHLQK